MLLFIIKILFFQAHRTKGSLKGIGNDFRPCRFVSKNIELPISLNCSFTCSGCCYAVVKLL